MDREKVLGDARYAQKERFRGWNIRPTVLDEPRLFPRVFPELTKADHERLAYEFAEQWKSKRSTWEKAIEAAERRYGNQGSLISGGFREHWPSKVKDRIRDMAHAKSALSTAAWAHWRAAGKRKDPPWKGT